MNMIKKFVNQATNSTAKMLVLLGILGSIVAPLCGFVYYNSIGNVMFPATSFGACNWSPTSDVGPCVNQAYAACAQAAGGTVLLPAGTYGLATTIANHTSGCKTQGQGTSFQHPNGQTGPLAVTHFVWIGSAGGGIASPSLTNLMFNLTSNTSQTLQNVDVSGVSFDCNSICDRNIIISDVSASIISLQWSNPVVEGAWITTSSGAYATNGFGTQNDHFSLIGNCTNSSPSACLVIDAQGGNFDISNDDFDFISVYMNNGNGVVRGFQDHNLFHFVQVKMIPTGTGIPDFIAGAPYTMLNGITTNIVHAFSYDKELKQESVFEWFQGTRTGSSITPNAGNSCNGAGSTACGSATLSLTTTAITPLLPAVAQNTVASTLTFANTGNLAVGMTAVCGVGLQGGVAPNVGIDAVTSTTAQMHYPAVFKQVPVGQVCTFSYGTTPTTSPGTYTITAVDGSHFNITGSAGVAGGFPAGNSQTGVALVNGVVTFTDLVWPFTGTPTAGDSWTFFVPHPVINADVTYTDVGGNNPTQPYFEIGSGGSYRAENATYPIIGGTWNNEVTLGFRCGTYNPFHNSGNIDISTANIGQCDNDLGTADLIIGSRNSQLDANSIDSMLLQCYNCVGTGTDNFAIGNNINISGLFGFAEGRFHMKAGVDTALFGNGVSDRARKGFMGYASGYFAAYGDAQTAWGVLRGSGSGSTPFNLEADGSGANNTTNCWNIPVNTDYALTLQAVERDFTTPGAAITWGNWIVLLHRGSTFASTTVTAASLPTPVSVGTVTGANVSITADTAYTCLNATLTPPSANTTDVWHGELRIESLELE